MLDWCVWIQQVDAMFDFARFWCCWLFEHICIARAQLLPSCINCLGAACCMGTLHLHLALACCIAWHRCIICCCALHCCIVRSIALHRCIACCIALHRALHAAWALCIGNLHWHVALHCIDASFVALHSIVALFGALHCIEVAVASALLFLVQRLQLLHGERWPGTTPYYTHEQASDSTRTANIARRCFLCFMHC